jgi:hypothetical protein
VLCANIGSYSSTAIKMRPVHPRWRMPLGDDVRNVAYNGALSINPGAQAYSPEISLGCQVRGAQGDIASPFSGFGDHLFRANFDDFAANQFSNLVNWLPTRGFSWQAPDWTEVPNDSCSWDHDADFPLLEEGVVCAAATGARPIAQGSQNDPTYGDRSPIMWTKTTSTKFVYLARIDTRFGPQQGGPNSHFAGANRAEEPTGSSVNIEVRDAYDSNYLSTSATYCYLNALPATLSDTVCSGPSAYFTGTIALDTQHPATSGHLVIHVPLTVGFTTAASLYVAVVRTKTTDFPPISTPIAAIGTIIDPGVARNEGGDAFIGDDVVFGFPEGQAFPWMGSF